MAESAAAPAPPPLQFEQLLFARSPFGFLTTVLIVFVLMFASFYAIASAEHVAVLRHLGPGFLFTDASWPALVLSLLCTAALAMQRYARVAEARDAPAYAAILTGGMASALNVTSTTPLEARFGRATLLGLLSGIVIAIIVRVGETSEGHVIPPFTMAWYAAATVLLMVLFMRGAEQTRAGNRSYGRVLNAELKIDLLRTDRLAVLGRSAARTALIWFVISAVACLFFINGDLNWLTALLCVSCAAMGGGMFVSVMSRIHKQIVAAKSAELEHIRCQVEAMRAAMPDDAQAAQKLHGLLAYEKRISEAPEWPFDQTTLVRVVASAFILTVPWFGQAVAAFVVERLTEFAK
jgi:hypothetical protein